MNVSLSDTIEAIYTPGSGFAGSTGSTTQTITARPITVTAASNTKTYDTTVTAAATPTVSGGLAAGDAATFTESYGSKHAGTNLTLTASGSGTTAATAATTTV